MGAHSSTPPAPAHPVAPLGEPHCGERHSVPSLHVSMLPGWQFGGTGWDQWQASWQRPSQRHPRTPFMPPPHSTPTPPAVPSPPHHLAPLFPYLPFPFSSSSPAGWQPTAAAPSRVCRSPSSLYSSLSDLTLPPLSSPLSNPSSPRTPRAGPPFGGRKNKQNKRLNSLSTQEPPAPGARSCPK